MADQPTEQQPEKRAKTGGRQKGTPNKATSQVKEFLGRVFDRAFTEKLEVTIGTGENARTELVGFEDALVHRIITLQIDSKLLAFLMAMHAGSPARQVEHKHSGKLTLEQLLSGVVPAEDEDEA